MSHQQQPGPSTLWRGGHVLSPTSPAATALRTEGDRITWVGPDADAPAADRTVDLDGALVTPSFVDSHVHLTGTGTALTGLDLAGTVSAADVLDRVAAYAKTLPSDAVVIGGGWDETTWDDPALPSYDEVDRAAGGRLAYLSRIDGHSGIPGSRIVSEQPEIGLLEYGLDKPPYRRMAHRGARAAVAHAVPVHQRLDKAREALAHAASLGITAVAEHSVPNDRDNRIEPEFQGLVALGTEPGLPTVFGWWGELRAAEKARDLGAHGCGGDLSVDGSLGSHTAYLRTPYEGTDRTGSQYLTADQIAAHLFDCHDVGLPAAFHAIGDGAVEAVLDGLDLVEPRVGLDAIRHARHRIEHAEVLDGPLVARMVHHGVHASVQPAFDAAWGGPNRMYAARLGRERALATNPFSHLAGVGVPLAFGSDSPVTPLDPWGGVRAALAHRSPVSRLPMAAAFTAATRGGWRALGIDDAGTLAPGARAHFTVWDASVPGLPDLSDPGTPDPVAATTVAAGHIAFSRT
ncbi:amidohydrolase family protein [Glycomyces sp. NPDC046736]|uniref:amidohydrolase n=1 Tax=Glycomyces sp. NPDC046736 TaxID=3155615 RepID=UPI0033CE0033